MNLWVSIVTVHFGAREASRVLVGPSLPGIGSRSNAGMQRHATKIRFAFDSRDTYGLRERPENAVGRSAATSSGPQASLRVQSSAEAGNCGETMLQSLTGVQEFRV